MKSYLVLIFLLLAGCVSETSSEPTVTETQPMLDEQISAEEPQIESLESVFFNLTSSPIGASALLISGYPEGANCLRFDNDEFTVLYDVTLKASWTGYLAPMELAIDADRLVKIQGNSPLELSASSLRPGSGSYGASFLLQPLEGTGTTAGANITLELTANVDSKEDLRNPHRAGCWVHPIFN